MLTRSASASCFAPSAPRSFISDLTRSVPAVNQTEVNHPLFGNIATKTSSGFRV